MVLLLLGPAVAHAAQAEGAGALSLLAPAVAIGLALATRKVIPSLATGAAVGALVASGGDPLGWLTGLAGFVFDAVFDLDHLKISLFSVFVAAMVGVLSVSGAMRALVERIQRVARGPRGAVVATWLSGLVVFFDDYANCLVVGNAMGPLCDRTGVSRAKLAYVVDATAAPVATLAVVSTWVAFQVDQIEDALQTTTVTVSAFGLFVQSLPYAFYSWLTIAFVGAVAVTGRDFGAMWDAEREARETPPPPEQEAAVLPAAWTAAVTIAMLVGATFALLLWTGAGAVAGGASRLEALARVPLFEIVGAAAAYDSMLIGSGLALLFAIGLATTRAGMAVRAVPAAAWTTVAPLLEALLVLYLAWTLGEAVHATGAGEYLAGALEGRLMPELLPAVTFVLAGLIAFSTGTSFGTMIILIPMVLPLGLALTGDPADPVVLGATAAVLSGSVLGDHTSPISDTTILSSLGAGVDLVTHVRTQLPYALTAGTIALGVGFVPAGFGVDPWLLVVVGCVACAAAVRLLGRTQPEPGAAAVRSDQAAI